MEHFLYLITSPIINGVKIGKTGNWCGLKKRYQTTYGENLIIYIFECKNRHVDEKNIHAQFSKHRLSGEIFNKDYIDDYICYCVKMHKLICFFDHSIKNVIAGECKETKKSVRRKNIYEYMSNQLIKYSMLCIIFITVKMRVKMDPAIEKNGRIYRNFTIKNNKYVKQTNFKYKNRIVHKSSHKNKHNSSIIFTGNDYNYLICINVDNVGLSVQKFDELCKDYGFDKKTFTVKTMSDGYHYYFILNTKQRVILKDSNLSNITLFNLAVEPKYNGQYVFGPTIIFDKNAKIKNEIIEFCDIKPLPDFIFCEIIRQSCKKNFSLNTSTNIQCESHTHTNYLKRRFNGDSVIKYFQRGDLESFINDNNLKDKPVIHSAKNYFENFFTSKSLLFDVEFITILLKFIDSLKNIETEQFMKDQQINSFINERLIITNDNNDSIKGTNLVDAYKLYAKNNDLYYTTAYKLFEEEKIHSMIQYNVSWFFGVKFKYIEDYKRDIASDVLFQMRLTVSNTKRITHV
jgi:hypothetical protein